ncbi:MAG: TetR family transcriptional regulator [Alphaproteobacteria bacterium]|nr:TetR family transcriptional regulator [Alphaproteobacteria bacterium]
MSVTEPQREDKRARIVEAASELFQRYGIKRTAIDDIAAAAGIAKGTIYLYFKSKDEVFAAVAEQLCEDAFARIAGAIAAGGDVVTKLTGVLDAKVGEIFRIINASPHSAELLESKKAVTAEAFTKLDALFKRSVADVLASDGLPGEAADMFIAAAYGAHQTGPGDAASYRARLKRHVAALVAGLKAR